MKKGLSLLMIPLGLMLAAAVSPEKIADVRAGRLTTARASWWGFDENDSWEILQSALDSGARTVIIDYTGKDWITSKTLNLPSNLELVLEDKVILEAKPGCFKRIGAPLIMARATKNSTVRGIGNATLKMHRRDYDDKTKYRPSTGRHIINLNGVTDVAIKNLHLTGSGGDGIYGGSGRQGYCKNVLIENVTADDGNRLGMAIISAENLVIRNCRFSRSAGVAVGGGLDFEPNYPTERLINCLVENCVIEGNRGAGVSISPNQLASDAPPVSITLKNCRFQNNGLGFFLYPYHKRGTAPKTPVKGEVNFIGCEFNGSSNLIQDAIAGYLRFNFKNCQFRPPATTQAAIRFICKFSSDYQIGNIFFENSSVECDPAKIDPLRITYQGTGTVSDQFGGTLQIINGNKKNMFDFPAMLKERKAYFNHINSLKPAGPVDLNHLGRMKKPRPAPVNKACIRYKCNYRQYAENGQSITVIAQGITGGYSGNIEVDLYAPSGKFVRKYLIPPDQSVNNITFKAAETGYYSLKCQTVQRLLLSSSHPGGAYELENGMQVLLPLSGRLYFEVPPGIGEFNIGVSADGEATVALINPAGKTVTENSRVSSMTILTAKSTNPSCSEIWAVEIRKAPWLVTLKMYDPLLPLLSLNPDTLPLKGNPETAVRGFIPVERTQDSGPFKNAGFEHFRKNFPLYWQNPRVAGSRISEVASQTYEGASCLKIETPSPLNMMSYSYIPVQSGKKITASVQVKGKGDFHLQLMRYTGEKKKSWIRPNILSEKFSIDSKDWKKISFETILPQKTARDQAAGWLRYSLSISADAALFFDDCRLEQTEP